MPESQATALAQAGTQAAETLLGVARVHKRSAAAHRRAARDAMQALDRLKAEYAALGINLEVQITDTGPGGHSDARTTNT